MRRGKPGSLLSSTLDLRSGARGRREESAAVGAERGLDPGGGLAQRLDRGRRVGLAGEVVAALSVVLPRETDPAAAIRALREAAAGIEAVLRADRR